LTITKRAPMQVRVVVRGRIELPTFRFSGGADAQLSPITLQGLAVRGCARLALAAHVAVTAAVSDHWAGCTMACQGKSQGKPGELPVRTLTLI
jgi:hypothetical protein